MAGGKKNKSQQNKSTKSSTPAASSSGDLSTSASTANQTTTNQNTNIFQTYTKEQLKAECRRRGQKTSGNKVELLQRLGHRMTNNAAPTTNTGTTTQTTKRNKDIITANGDRKQQLDNNLTAATTPTQPPTNNMSTTKFPTTKSRNCDKIEREDLVIWKHPIITLKYSFLETFDLIYSYGNKLIHYRNRVILIVLVCTLLLYSMASDRNLKLFTWSLYWIGLGVLSSVGLGTGLHTFILYLGPHIAKVTLAAYECNALNFPSPPYPDEIICPTEPDLTNPPSILSIMSKVRVEAMLWGAGTALGELPPYFMARAARMSGHDPEDENELREFQELQRKKLEHPESLTTIEKAKSMVETLVRKVGFFGILAAASIPNPLFDLAGITCGHFLIPFWTFFGATLIGKAIIKMHIQKLFVIIAFNELLVEKFIQLIDFVPVIGAKMQEPVRRFFVTQKAKLHRDVSVDESGNVLAWIFEKFVMLMILYFVVSIINSLAQVHHKKLSHSSKRSEKLTKKKIGID